MQLIESLKRLCLNFGARGRVSAAILALACVLAAAHSAADASTKPHASAAAKHHADPEASPQTADDAHRFSISGTVVAVHYDANSVTVSSGEKRVEIVITPTTVIEYRHEAGSIADIHKGRKISASGVVRDGSMVALTIVLK